MVDHGLLFKGRVVVPAAGRSVTIANFTVHTRVTKRCCKGL